MLYDASYEHLCTITADLLNKYVMVKEGSV
jgi:hypothetical protein